MLAYIRGAVAAEYAAICHRAHEGICITYYPLSNKELL
jgi:hypothetical protein